MKLATLVTIVFLGFGTLASSQEMGSTDEQKTQELIAKIQKDLNEIDRLLLEADRTKAGSVKEKMSEAAKNIAKLLEDAQKNQAAVCESIEELVRMTKYQKSSNSSDGDGEGSEGKPQKNRERSKDKEPSELLPQPEQQQPEPKDGEKPGEKPKPKPGDQTPEDGEPDPSDGEQTDTDRQKPPSEKSEFQRADTSGRWGVLPQKEAELLQSLSQHEFPEKYRKLIFEFYRRANQVEKKP